MKCPHTNEEVFLPCGLDACGFHVDHPHHKNCALVYADAKDDAPCDESEIAYLYDIPIEDVVAKIKEGMEAMRQDGEGNIGFTKQEPEPESEEEQHPAFQLLTILDDIIKEMD